MAKRLFFSFHYEDVKKFRANVVRNSWVTQERQAAGYFDASLWEEAQKKGVSNLKNLINNGLKNTSATCVLIGEDTYYRRWVRYEIAKSIEVGNKLIGIYIHNIKDKNQNKAKKGKNPFDYLGLSFDNDGTYINFIEYKNGKWVNYKDLEGMSIEKMNKYKGKSVKLSEFYKTYDWINDNGYLNLADWIK